MGAAGTATLDFGAAPGSGATSVAVTGQASILATSHVEAWLMAETSADHNVEEHALLAEKIGLSCTVPVAATGFTIHARTELRLTGTVKVRWVWAD